MSITKIPAVQKLRGPQHLMAFLDDKHLLGHNATRGWGSVCGRAFVDAQ